MKGHIVHILSDRFYRSLHVYVYTGPYVGIFIGHLFSVGWIQHIFLERALTGISFIPPLHQHPTILFCKAKRQYLLTSMLAHHLRRRPNIESTSFNVSCLGEQVSGCRYRRFAQPDRLPPLPSNNKPPTVPSNV